MKKLLFLVVITISNLAFAQEEINVSRENLATLYANAQKAEQASEYEKAISIYRSILFLDNKQPVPYLKIGNLYALNTEKEVNASLAITFYEKYLELEPDNRKSSIVHAKVEDLQNIILENGWQLQIYDLPEIIQSEQEQIRDNILDAVHPAMKAETKEEIEEFIDNSYSLWDKAQLAYQNNDIDLAIQHLTDVVQTTHPSQPLFAQANAMLADIYANQGNFQKMQEVLEMLENNMRADTELIQHYKVKLKDAIPFEDDICGIWVSNLSTDINKLPYLAIEISKRGREYNAVILPYCTFAEINKMYKGKAFNRDPKELKSEDYVGYLPYSNASEIDNMQNRISFVFGDEKYRQGLNEEFAKETIDFVGEVGKGVVETLPYDNNLTYTETQLASGGVMLATAMIQGLTLLATIGSKVRTLYDLNIEELFSGCADLKLIESRAKEKSTGYEKVSADTISMKIFKLYREYNITFTTKDNELFGYKQFNESEIESNDEYQHVVALEDKSWFNKQAYKTLQNQIVDFCWNKADENPQMQKMAFKCKDYIENGMQGLMFRKFTNANGYFNGWVDFSNEMNGLGTCKLATGEEYVGNWENNKYSGQGKLTFTNGTVYTGMFKNGKCEGNGKYINGNDYYEGEWVNNKWNGQGKLVENGITYEGLWKNGKIKTGTIVFANGNQYKGSMKKKKDKKTEITQWVPNGKGVMTKADGTTLDGKWINGEFTSEN